MRKFALALAAVAAASVSVPSSAGTVLSQDFESGPAGWFLGGSVGIYTGLTYPVLYYPIDGSLPTLINNHFVSLDIGQDFGGELISPYFGLVPGTDYTLEFDFRTVGIENSGEIKAYLIASGLQTGGFMLLPNNNLDSPWTHVSYRFTAPVPYDYLIFQSGIFSDTDTLVDNIRLTGQVVEGVPEPATWAMMLLGFGAIGASMRLRRRETDCCISEADA